MLNMTRDGHDRYCCLVKNSKKRNIINPTKIELQFYIEQFKT